MRLRISDLEAQRERAKRSEGRLTDAHNAFVRAGADLRIAKINADQDRQSLAELEQLWDAERAERTAHITVDVTGWKESA